MHRVKLPHVVVAMALLFLAGCGTDTTTQSPAQSTETTKDFVSPLRVESVLPTPRPDAAEAAALTDAVVAAYPPLAERADKAVDWSVSVCDDILDGKPDATVTRNIVLRFAGGDRPEPTPDQAQGILAAVQASGFCVL